VPVKREQLEKLIREPVMQTIDLIRICWRKNNCKHEDINRIVFIGGPSRIPLVRKMVSEELGIGGGYENRSDDCVAVGAAYYAKAASGIRIMSARLSPSRLRLPPPQDLFVVPIHRAHAGR